MHSTARTSSPIQSSPGLGYVRELDGIRAIAISFVLVTHFSLAPRILLSWLPWGELGVRIFFVLSGYLITGILLRCRAIADANPQLRRSALRTFYIRRFLRIFPVYYGSLIVLYACGVPAISQQIGWHVGYATNFRMAWLDQSLYPAGHLWSLSVEEQFYLVWPWLMIYSSKAWLRRGVFCAIALGVLSRGVAAGWGQSHLAATILTSSCLDTLGLGALLALYSRPDYASSATRDRFIRVSRAVGPVTLFTSLVLRDLDIAPRLGWVASDLGIALSTVWLIDHVVRTRSGGVCRLLATSPLVAVGKISYGLYLYHRFVQSGLPVAAQEFGLVEYFRGAVVPVLVVGGSVGLAQLSWVLYERPIQRMKRHFRYDQSE